MSLRALALDWSLDGSVGIAFLVLCVAAGGVYASAAAIGSRRDRRRRRWPRRRTACFMRRAGGAGRRPLLRDRDPGRRAAVGAHGRAHGDVARGGAAAGRRGADPAGLLRPGPRRAPHGWRGWLHSRPLAWLTSPVGSVTRVLSGAAGDPCARPSTAWRWPTTPSTRPSTRAYLAAALLMWAPLLGVDPLPHRLAPAGPGGMPGGVHGADAAGGGVAGPRAARRLPPLRGRRSARPRCTTSGWRPRSCGRAACRRSPSRRAQTYELASASLTGGAGVVSTLGADSDVISGLVGAVELPETSAASAWGESAV